MFVACSVVLIENNEPMWCVASTKAKITSAVWGPLDEVIITGHENGDLCLWDVSVRLFVYCFMLFSYFKREYSDLWNQHCLMLS